MTTATTTTANKRQRAGQGERNRFAVAPITPTRETPEARAQKFAPRSEFRYIPSTKTVLLTSGNSGRTYRLTEDENGALCCSCPAGQAGRACWHRVAAAVYLAKWEEAKAGGYVYGWIERGEQGVGTDYCVILNIARVLPAHVDDWHIFRTREQLSAFVEGWRVDSVVANGVEVAL